MLLRSFVKFLVNFELSYGQWFIVSYDSANKQKHHRKERIARGLQKRGALGHGLYA